VDFIRVPGARSTRPSARLWAQHFSSNRVEFVIESEPAEGVPMKDYSDPSDAKISGSSLHKYGIDATRADDWSMLCVDPTSVDEHSDALPLEPSLGNTGNM
jgi:hypothetical protein